MYKAMYSDQNKPALKYNLKLPVVAFWALSKYSFTLFFSSMWKPVFLVFKNLGMFMLYWLGVLFNKIIKVAEANHFF